jgi:uncharacterized protein (DUF2384 family)
VFSFEWNDAFWVPMFQFERDTLSIRLAPRQVLAELAKAFDGWTLAVWFTRPSSALNGRRPIELLDIDLSAVLAMARTDRFVFSA